MAPTGLERICSVPGFDRGLSRRLFLSPEHPKDSFQHLGWILIKIELSVVREKQTLLVVGFWLRSFVHAAHSRRWQRLVK